MKKSILTLLAILFLTFAAQAADITGKWWVDTSAAAKGQGGRGGSVFGGEFEFKVSGETLTGTATRAGVGGRWVLAPIADGRIAGDAVSFTTTVKDRNGDDDQWSYTGKIVGDRIELTVDAGGRSNPRQVTLKRAP